MVYKIVGLTMRFNRNKTIINFLKRNEGQEFTPPKIAEWLVKTYPEEVKKKAARSKNEILLNVTDPLEKDKRMLGIISGEMHKDWFKSIQRQEPNIKREEYPRRYYYKKTDQVEIEGAEKEPSLKEKEIYPKLKDFLLQELGVYSKIINDKCSSNSKGTNGNKWLHPDLVGIEDLTKDWTLVTKNCVKQFADKKAKLWSFEVKIVINSTNVRQSFFQALSNSSWAHYGYLVASSLVEAGKDDTLCELEILAARHGIGFILLNIKEPVEKGRVLIPAKERLEIDWDMANRLVEENKHFKSFIEEVDDFHLTGKIRLS